MKKRIIIFLMLFAIITSCEKDDICVDTEASTPHLVINFLDISQQEKPAINLLIEGDGNALPYGVVSTQSTISIPLKTLENSTTFKLTIDDGIDDNGTPSDTSDDSVNRNEDQITITYEKESIYISKACGFKTIFKNVTFEVIADADNWIANSTLLTTTIENENNAHVYIYH